ncbi:MAG: CRISPR-associated protein Cas4, partial [Firmicutes bacterium]|nr:CRISPR-associated protein Cas4 [Bacillota bacterium]
MEYLPISKINTFAFCQRRFFYEYVLHIQDVNYHVLEGRYLHEDVYAEHDEDAAVWVWSDRLGLVGVVDLIEHQAGSPIPVEYKKGRRNHFDGDALQLCAQGICIEEQRNVNVTHGYVYYHATRR